MFCPRCGSENVHPMSETVSNIKGYGCCKGGLGYIIFGPIGALCGLCGMGEGTTVTSTLWVCENCGNKFK